MSEPLIIFLKSELSQGREAFLASFSFVVVAWIKIDWAERMDNLQLFPTLDVLDQSCGSGQKSTGIGVKETSDSCG